MLGCGQLVGNKRFHKLMVSRDLVATRGDWRYGLVMARWFGMGGMGPPEEEGWEEGKSRREDKGLLE